MTNDLKMEELIYYRNTLYPVFTEAEIYILQRRKIKANEQTGEAYDKSELIFEKHRKESVKKFSDEELETLKEYLRLTMREKIFIKHVSFMIETNLDVIARKKPLDLEKAQSDNMDRFMHDPDEDELETKFKKWIARMNRPKKK